MGLTLVICGAVLVSLGYLMMSYSNKVLERAHKNFSDSIKERKRANKIYKEINLSMGWGSELMDLVVKFSKGLVTRDAALKRVDELRRNQIESQTLVKGLVAEGRREYEQDQEDG